LFPEACAWRHHLKGFNRLANMRSYNNHPPQLVRQCKSSIPMTPQNMYAHSAEHLKSGMVAPSRRPADALPACTYIRPAWRCIQCIQQALYVPNMPLLCSACASYNRGKHFLRACEKAIHVDQSAWWCGCRIRPLSHLFTYWLAEHGSLFAANMRRF
jgi:hypothetical protein